MILDGAGPRLTADELAELRRPFTVAAIRFKPQTVSKGDNPKGMATFYIDARLAAERLNHVVGPEGWQDEYRLLLEQTPEAAKAHHWPVECKLTVRGVTKADVGNYQSASADDKSMKSAYSDALKRAAVKFGVGAYLYAMPKVWAPVKVGSNGKAQGFTDAGERQLRQAYEKACKAVAERFGAPLEHGETDEVIGAPEEPADGPTSPVDAEPTGPRALVDDDHKDVKRMKELAAQVGYKPEQIQAVCDGARKKARTGDKYEMGWVVGTIEDLNRQLAERSGEGEA